MDGKEWCPENVLDIFGDSVSRAILVLANEQPVTAPDLADSLDVSPPAIYRRIRPLVDANLLEEQEGIDRDGNHHKRYKTVLNEVTFSVQNDGYSIATQVDQNLADDFESMWSDLESSGPEPEAITWTSSSRDTKKGGDPT